MISIKNAPSQGAFCCSTNPLHRTQIMRLEDSILCSEQERKMGLCMRNKGRQQFPVYTCSNASPAIFARCLMIRTSVAFRSCM